MSVVCVRGCWIVTVLYTVSYDRLGVPVRRAAELEIVLNIFRTVRAVARHVS